MKKSIAIVYASYHGHTQKIAEYVAASLYRNGFDANLINIKQLQPDICLAAYSAILIAAPVHAGDYPTALVKFVKAKHETLQKMPNAFISVTLSEAGAERDNTTTEEHIKFVTDVQRMAQKFIRVTHWQPKLIQHVAGALAYTQYNRFLRLVMKRIARAAGGSTDTRIDHDYTDWLALDKLVETIVRQLNSASKFQLLFDN